MIYLGNQAVGIPVGVGNLTQYEQKTASGVGNNSNPVIFAVSFPPKIVEFSGGTDSTGNIINGSMDFIQKIGTVNYRNSANGNLATSGYRPAYSDTVPSGANICKYYDGKIYISRPNTNGNFAAADTFTFYIYG